MKCDENCFECKYDDCIIKLPKEIGHQTPEQTRLKQNAKKREKYRTNPTFRAKAIANSKKQYLKNKERYWTDPEYREMVKAKAREKYHKRKGKNLYVKQGAIVK